MGLSWYNGFSPKEREEGDKIIKHAINIGKLKPLNQCICKMCGQSKGVLHYHTEDYSPLKIVEKSTPLCWRCHMMLHGRFREPEAWEIYKEEIIVHKKQYPPMYSCSFKELNKFQKELIEKHNHKEE